MQEIYGARANLEQLVADSGLEGRVDGVAAAQAQDRHLPHSGHIAHHIRTYSQLRASAETLAALQLDECREKNPDGFDAQQCMMRSSAATGVGGECHEL